MDELRRALATLAPYVGLATFILGGISWIVKQYLDGQKKIKLMEAKEVLASVSALDKQLGHHRSSIEALNNNMLLAYEKIGQSNVRLERVSVSSDLLVKEIAEASKNSQKRLRDIEDTMQEAQIIPLGKDLVMIKSKKRD